MKRILLLLFAFLSLVSIHSLPAQDDPLFFFYDPFADPLAPRDESGLFHQSRRLESTDFAPRHESRFAYYFKSGEQLSRDPAYVGVLQYSLRLRGYYCGPIDGVFTNQVSEAISRLQKNYRLHVTGTLTAGVRRALHLP